LIQTDAPTAKGFLAMAMQASEIERLIKEAIPDAEVRIEDLRGDGDHALQGRMGGELHALALQTAAPENG
jgi:stress-induced morphogen